MFNLDANEFSAVQAVFSCSSWRLKLKKFKMFDSDSFYLRNG